MIFKPTLEEGYKSIISKKVGSKNIKMVYDENGCKLTKNIPVSKKDQEKFSINDNFSVPLKKARENFEKEYLTTQLKKFGGNISKTAKFVGMERSALHRKLKSLGIKGIN